MRADTGFILPRTGDPDCLRSERRIAQLIEIEARKAHFEIEKLKNRVAKK